MNPLKRKFEDWKQTRQEKRQINNELREEEHKAYIQEYKEKRREALIKQAKVKAARAAEPHSLPRTAGRTALKVGKTAQNIFRIPENDPFGINPSPKKKKRKQQANPFVW